MYIPFFDGQITRFPHRFLIDFPTFPVVLSESPEEHRYGVPADVDVEGPDAGGRGAGGCASGGALQVLAGQIIVTPTTESHR